uniref:Truncated NadA n=1 Tax=Neisseria meningitidis TaxID=487 RepID=B9W068_NEIME|nr:truncated NadA [Neisseria meningitidis]
MKHFQSKVLTAAILASFCSGALAASNSDETEVAREVATAALVGAYNNAKKSTVSKSETPSTTLMEAAKLPQKKQPKKMSITTTLKVWV